MENYRELLDYVMVPDSSIDTGLMYKWISAEKLLTADRIDLVVKLVYLKSMDTSFGCNYGEHLYKEHLACFSHGCFYEPGNKEKDSFDDFKYVFNKTFLSIKNNGYDSSSSLIPVSRNSCNLIDGAHRVSCSIYLGVDIPVIEVNIPKKKFDMEYFKKEGMNQTDIDFLCHKYIDFNTRKNFNAICVWPRAAGFLNEINSEIYNKFNVLSKKNVTFNANGAHNFLSQIYSHDQWVGSYENDYQGVNLKRNECFKDNSTPLVVYFVESEYKLDFILEFKNQLREKFGFGKHLLHVTDSKSECLQICELVLNNNSLVNLNSSYPTSSKKFQREFSLFLKEINRKGIPKENLCIVGGAVLSVFGIRDTEDIDFITISSDITLSNRFDLKNYEFDGLDINPDDVILDPNNHFYYMGIKFCSLSIVSKLKKHRGEPKDFDDVKAVELFLKAERSFRSDCYMKIFLLKRFLRRSFITFRVTIGRVLKFIGLFSLVKNILKKVGLD